MYHFQAHEEFNHRKVYSKMGENLIFLTQLVSGP